MHIADAQEAGVFSNSGMGLKLALVVDLLLFGLIGLKVEV